MLVGNAEGTVSLFLNIGTDADGAWYNAAYGNNAGVPRIHRWLTGGTERMRKEHALSGNAIEVECLDSLAAAYCSMQPRLIIRDAEEDVGSISAGLGRGPLPGVHARGNSK